MTYNNKKYSSAIFALLGIIGFTIYSNVLHGEFISDDFVTIVNNSAIRHLDNIGQIWYLFNTRFLTGYTFAVNYRIGGLDPLGYHLVNIFIHIINAWLVFCLASLALKTPVMQRNFLGRISSPIPFYAAMIYLCHPIQTQAVAYITQRAVSLATLFYLVSLILYIKGRLEGNYRYFICSWMAMLIGVFAKEMIVTLPMSLLGFEMFFFESKIKDSIQKALPYILIAALVPLALYADQPGSVLKLREQVSHREFSLPYFLAELIVVKEYWRMMVFPLNQNHDYDMTLIKSLWNSQVLFALILILCVVWLAVVNLKKSRWISYWIFWYFITASIEFWVPVFVNRGVMYEHWLYLPMVGFSMLAAFVITEIFKKKFSQQIIFFCIIFILCTMSYTRNLVWQNEIVFWEDVLRKSPQKPTAYLGAGVAYQRKGYDDLALKKYRRGVELFYQRRPHFAQELDRIYLARVYNNMGQIYFSREQDAQALEYWKKSVETYPHMAENYSNLGFYYFIKYDYRRALEFYNKSLQNLGDQRKACVYRRLVLRELKEKDDTDSQFPQCKNKEKDETTH